MDRAAKSDVQHWTTLLNDVQRIFLVIGFGSLPIYSDDLQQSVKISCQMQINQNFVCLHMLIKEQLSEFSKAFSQ